MAYVHATCILRLVLIYTSVTIGISLSTCRPPGSDGKPYCCPFYYLKNNSCEECPAGYDTSPDSDNCSVPCRPLSYGAWCRSRCNCSKEDCHHVYGCPVTRKPPPVLNVCTIEKKIQCCCIRSVTYVGVIMVESA